MTEEGTIVENSWEEVVGEQGKTIRWNEVATAKQEKTIYIGTVLEGIYEGKKTGVGKNLANIYNVRSKKHGLLSFWGSTVLDDKFAEIPVGYEVRVETTGEQTSKKGATYFGFKVFFRPGPMKEAGAAESEDEEGGDIPM